MNDDDTLPDSLLVAAALEQPISHYLQWIHHEQVAPALAMFKTEREIRKTGRLDLVTWVQYICGFGYAGPSDDAWARLFSACRVMPTIPPARPYLRVHEIAVLLAYAKIRPDNGDTMTPAQLVKHRIRPAVLGRSVARTPGILYHIQQKFDRWALGPFTDTFCTMCVDLCRPQPVVAAHNPSPAALCYVGETIRQSAIAHTNSLLKSWAAVVSSILELDLSTKCARVARFQNILDDKRRFIYQHMYVKISEQWLRPPVTESLSTSDHYTHSDHMTQSEEHYTHSEYTPVGNVNHEALVSAKLASGINMNMSAARGRSIHNSMWQCKAGSTRWQYGVVTAQVIVCELHRPSRYGQAALDFVSSEAGGGELCAQEQLATGMGTFSGKTYLRMGLSKTKLLCTEVKGVPLSHACRGLRLVIKVKVEAGDAGGTRPRFEAMEIVSCGWVELGLDADKCSRRMCGGRVGCSGGSNGTGGTEWLGGAGGMRRERFDLNKTVRRVDMEIAVEQRMMERLHTAGASGVELDTGCGDGGGRWSGVVVKDEEADGANWAWRWGMDGGSGEGSGESCEGGERFTQTCWIEWHTAAVVTYVTAPAGGEVLAATAVKTDC